MHFIVFAAKAIKCRGEIKESYKVRHADFEDSPAGRLIPTVYNQKAFVPNPLPPKLDLSTVAIELANAMAAVGELKGACRLLANPYILIRPLQRLEAQTSSAMEGTFTTADDLVMAEAGVARSPSAEAIEVNNYSRALSWAVSEMENVPISVRLIEGAHRILLEHVGKSRGQDKQPGEFARDQNMIGGASIETARFVPPPPKETAEAMSHLERYINRDHRNPGAALIDLALVHYQFETIHPFADGNGRVGRMLISLMAISEGLLDMPILYMSPELEKEKDAYIDHMYDVSSKGAWEAYLKMFLRVTVASCRRSITTIDRILDLQKRYHDVARSKSRSNNMNAVVDMLFETPVIQPPDIIKRTGITDAAARNLLRQLTEAGILEESKVFYPTVWLAGELLDVSRP
ncbi:MAG: Fic family protein [Pseudomonadota bacterium]